MEELKDVLGGPDKSSWQQILAIHPTVVFCHTAPYVNRQSAPGRSQAGSGADLPTADLYRCAYQPTPLPDLSMLHATVLRGFQILGLQPGLEGAAPATVSSSSSATEANRPEWTAGVWCPIAQSKLRSLTT